MLFVACWGIQRELGVRIAVVGMRDTPHQTKFGWIMSIVPAMKPVSQRAVMVGGEVTTAGTVKMWESSASLHQKLRQVDYFKLFLKTAS